MANSTFEAIEYAYNMSEAEWLTLKNKLLLLRRHHIRALNQLQLFERQGLVPTHPLYRRANRRLRSIEKRIDQAQHKLAHARRYEAFVEAESGGIGQAVVGWLRQNWRWHRKHTTA